MKRLNQTRLEWALLGVIGIVCAVLSLVQYRWSSEVSRAERAQLRSGLDEQVLRFTRAFNEEIRESCGILMPEAPQLREDGRERAHLKRYRQWTASHDRSLFSRIGIVVPEDGTLKLYGIDDGKIEPISWPPDWATLRAEMIARVQDSGPPPTAPHDSKLLEAPIFANPRHRDESGSELEWMIFELNTDYLCNKLLPAMVAEYFNPGGETVYDVSVSQAGPHGRILFTTRPDKGAVTQGADAEAGILSAEIGGSPGRRRGRFHDEGGQARWTLAVRHRAGSLDAVVAQAQRRNLATSLVLIGLLGGAAAALVRYTARSRRLADMQFRFAAGVSHDLRTPLTSIRGAAFNLVSGVVKEPAAVGRYGNIILRNAEELTAMIENVLAFSATLHSGRQDRLESFDVGDLLEHAAAAMAHEVEQAGCRIEVNVAPELPVVSGDPVALEHAFRNLIGNAVRHAAQGKWIGVAAARAGDGVDIRVSDRGPGIPETERERIFEPFFRGEQTRASQVRGTGLGLSLVKEAIQRHRGTVTVQNSPGGGALFTVHLPAVPEAA